MATIGSVTLDELMTGLMSAHDTFQQAMDIEIREEVITNTSYPSVYSVQFHHCMHSWSPAQSTGILHFTINFAILFSHLTHTVPVE